MNISLELSKCSKLISSLSSNYSALISIENQLKQNKKALQDILIINEEFYLYADYNKIITNVREKANYIKNTLLPSARRAYNELLAMLEEE